jgi:hypothetical protein
MRLPRMTTRRWMVLVAVAAYVVGLLVFGLALASIGFRFICAAGAPSPPPFFVSDTILPLLGIGWIVAATAILIASRPIPLVHGSRRRLGVIFAATISVSVAFATVVAVDSLFRAWALQRTAAKHLLSAHLYSPKAHPELRTDAKSMAKLKFHLALWIKYCDASTRPWLPVPPDPPEPK